MNLRSLWASIIACPVNLEAAAAAYFDSIALPIEHEAETVFHTVEEEITVSIPQAISDAIAKIAGRRASDAQTITNLQAQVEQLTSDGQAKDAKIADLTQQLSDVAGAVADEANASAPQT